MGEMVEKMKGHRMEEGSSKDHPIMVQAYLDFLHWALGFDKLLKQFKEETGAVYIPPSGDGLAALVDKACGVDETNKEFVRMFVIWVTENYWGEEDETPQIFFETFKGVSGCVVTNCVFKEKP